MADPADNAADRLDEWLDADGRSRAEGEIETFAGRVLREAALPEPQSTSPSREQRRRMRERVFSEVSGSSKARTPVNAHVFEVNGTSPTPLAAKPNLPADRDDRSSPSGLSILMMAAVVALIGIAAFGLVRDSINFSPGGNDSQPANAPGVVLQPNATPTDDQACDLSRDIPTFTGSVPETVDGTALLLNESGTLELVCNQHSLVVAEDVESVSALGWPGTFTTLNQNGTVTVHNLDTGESLDIGPREVVGPDPRDAPAFVVLHSGYEPGIPWLVIPAGRDARDLRVIDLRTIDSFLISDDLGNVEPTALQMGMSVSVSANLSTVAVSFLSEIYRVSDKGAFEGMPPREGTLIVSGSVEERQWVESFNFTGAEPSVSPDGTWVATYFMKGPGTYARIVDADIGEELARVQLTYDGPQRPRFALTGTGDPGLFVWDNNGGRVHRWDDEGTETVTELDALDSLPDHSERDIYTTSDPNTLLLTLQDNAADRDSAVIVLDTETGATTLHESVPSLWNQVRNRPPDQDRLVVGHAIDDRSATLRLVDLTNGGEILAETEPFPLDIIQLTNDSMATLSDDGSMATVVLPSGEGISLNAETGLSWSFELPEGAEGDADSVGVSPGGDYLMYFERGDGGFAGYFWRPAVPDAAWTEGPVEQGAQFIPGVAASPEATPEEDATCNPGGRVDVFNGTVPEFLQDAPHATLDDGTLTWYCDGSSEVLATDVHHASGAFWPGVIAMAMEDDTVRLLNIASAMSIELESEEVVTENGEIDFQNAFYRSGGPEPWLITPVNADHTDWRVIDLRSMESFLLSDELDGPLPEPSFPEFGQITGTDASVITWHGRDSFLAATPLAEEAGVELTGSIRALVLPSTIADRRWVDVAQYGIQSSRQFGYSQLSSVSPDGSLLAYTTLTDTYVPVIRIEQAIDGTHIVDVPIDDIDLDTRFMLAGEDPHLVYANGESVRLFGLVPNAVREIAEWPGPDITGFLPTADPNTVLFLHNNGGTTITRVNVANPEAQTEFYNYAPPAFTQVFGTDELPQNIVRVISDELSGRPATIQLVNPGTGEVLLESDPIDAHPIQIVSFSTYLRNEGTLAVVPIGYNRAIVMDADAGEAWEISAPIDDDRLWHFYPSADGRYISAYPEPPEGTADYQDTYIAPPEPNGEWVPIEQGVTVSNSINAGTPVPPTD